MQIEKILSDYDGIVDDIKDLIGDDEPSKLFYFLIDKLGYLLSNNPDDVLSLKGKERRDKFNKILKVVGPLFLSSKQIIVDRNELQNDKKYNSFILNDDPVIWAPTHSFKDDALATVLSIPRNAYFLFGSLPQFYNTFDGVTAWLNGSIIVNRKNKSSRKASIEKCKKAIDLGIDLIIYPEGVWNKTPNLLTLNLWPGVYRIAKEKNIKIVPVIHYKKNPEIMTKKDYIYTLIDDPIAIDNMNEKQALNYLRDVYNYWTYLLMDKYGKSTRENEIGCNNSADVWEEKLMKRVQTAARYDYEIETSADYNNNYVLEEDVWNPIASVNNITANNILMVEHAKEKIKELKRNNFQRRF